MLAFGVARVRLAERVEYAIVRYHSVCAAEAAQSTLRNFVLYDDEDPDDKNAVAVGSKRKGIGIGYPMTVLPSSSPHVTPKFPQVLDLQKVVLHISTLLIYCLLILMFFVFFFLERAAGY